MEKSLQRRGYKLVAGADEAGRGAWAGPLVAAAVVLPTRFRLPGLDDSKRLTPAARERLFAQIVKQAIAWSVEIITVRDVDATGVHRANHRALRQSIARLHPRPQMALIDGFALAIENIPTQRVVGGDHTVAVIAAASIIAKVTRDRLMARLHRQYPRYGFDRHKGYGTRYHDDQLKRYGPCSVHRQSFRPIRQYRFRAAH